MIDRASPSAVDLPARVPEVAAEAIDPPPAHADPPRHRRRWPGAARFGLPLASVGSVAAVILLWWLVASVFIRDQVTLPTPLAVARQAGHLIALGDSPSGLWPNLEASLVRVLIGWGLAGVVGVPLGAVMGGNRVARAMIDPLLESGRAVPPLAFAPLLVVWLGIGETSKFVLLFLTALPVIAISTAAGIAGVDEALKRAAMTLGASRLYLYRRVVVPGALPEIITGVRVASGLTWSSLVAAEIIAATRGIGWMILQASNYLQTATIFVGIISIGIVAYLMDRMLRIIQRYVTPWKGRA